MPDIRTSLNGRWLFRTDAADAGLREHWYASPWPEAGAKPIDVPAPWERSGYPDYDGAGWYQRNFDLPAAANGQVRGVCITAVDDSAIVWVNGVEVAREERYNRRFAFTLDGAARPGRNTITVRINDTGGPGGLIGDVFWADVARFEDLLLSDLARSPARESADWVRDAVIYCVYIRSFSPEATFKGVEQRLDHIQKLGATTIWLLPIHPVGVKHRKGSLGSPYAIRDYYGINPEFGTLDDFKSLLKAAHARGLKLIIDLVANHTSWDNDLIEKHPDWYARDERGQIRPPNPDWSDVAQLDYSRPALRRYMTDMMLYWVRDIAIDGFRCDVAGMVPNDFWVEARRELDAVKPVMMLAEDDQPLQHVAAFDLTYDWHTWDHLGRMTDDKLTADAFRNLLLDESLLYPQGSLRMRFSSNHDKNAWVMPAITRYGPDGAKLAAVTTFVLPGVPQIYNGQEAANPLALSLFEKVSIDWTRKDEGLPELYAALAALRRDRISLRRGATEVWPVAGNAQLLALRRSHEAETTFALLNLSNRPQEAALRDLPPDTTTLYSNGELTNVDGGRRVRLPARGWWVGGTPSTPPR